MYFGEHRINGKIVKDEVFISGILLKSKFVIAREWTSGISKFGNIISQVGLGLTVTVVGAEIGVPLMAIGGQISLLADAGTALSYAIEGKWDKFGMQAIETGVSFGASKATGGLLKMKSPGQSEIANEAQRAVAEEINGRVASEGVKMIQVEVKTPMLHAGVLFLFQEFHFKPG